MLAFNTLKHLNLKLLQFGMNNVGMMRELHEEMLEEATCYFKISIEEFLLCTCGIKAEKLQRTTQLKTGPEQTLSAKQSLKKQLWETLKQRDFAGKIIGIAFEKKEQCWGGAAWNRRLRMGVILSHGRSRAKARQVTQHQAGSACARAGSGSSSNSAGDLSCGRSRAGSSRSKAADATPHECLLRLQTAELRCSDASGTWGPVAQTGGSGKDQKTKKNSGFYGGGGGIPGGDGLTNQWLDRRGLWGQM
ncbi:uncharacterized protein LOC141728485 isoform X2 [Zonotrichia albicollis]|uniref:uncharacterized protein LOC141728485 isoform X2 n=1 Tax=Zonotrichia albicollis TaxID=44394 RepID=UPI003D81030B